jgi:hypothetical protein
MNEWLYSSSLVILAPYFSDMIIRSIFSSSFEHLIAHAGIRQHYMIWCSLSVNWSIYTLSLKQNIAKDDHTVRGPWYGHSTILANLWSYFSIVQHAICTIFGTFLSSYNMASRTPLLSPLTYHRDPTSIPTPDSRQYDTLKPIFIAHFFSRDT